MWSNFGFGSSSNIIAQLGLMFGSKEDTNDDKQIHQDGWKLDVHKMPSYMNDK
jgi:hypothetical protein